MTTQTREHSMFADEVTLQYIADLEATIKEQDDRITFWENECKELQLKDDKIIQEQAAEIARQDGLIAALEKLACLGNGDQHGNSVGNEIAIAALRAFKE